MIWTAEDEQRFARCVADGMSSGQAGAELGITRSAAIGKAKRMKLTWDRARGEVQQRRVRPKRRGPPAWHQPPAHAVRTEPVKIVTGDPAEIPERQRKSILDLGNEHCRWPYGDVGTPDFFFCGAPEADCSGGQPYCRAHSAIAYSPRRSAA